MAFADNFIRAYQAGQQSKRHKEEQAFELEDRADRRKLMTLKLKQEELEDKSRTRQEAIQNAQLMQGQPGRNPMQAGVEGQLPATAKSPVVPLEAQQVPHKPMQIPGAYGAEGVSVQPQTQAEVQAQSMQEALSKMGLEKLKNTYSLDIGGKQETGPLAFLTEKQRGVTAAAGREDTQAFTAAENEKSATAANARTAATNTARLQAAGITQGGSDRRNAENIAARERLARERMGAAEKLAQTKVSLKDLPGPTSTKIEDLGSALFGLKQIEDMKTTFSSLIGPIQGRTTTPLRQWAGLTSGEEETALSTMQNYFNVLVKARSGGAVTPSEEARMKAELQDKTLTQEQFAGRLKTQKSFLRARLKLVSAGLSPAHQTKVQEQMSAIGLPDWANESESGRGGGTPKILSIERIE